MRPEVEGIVSDKDQRAAGGPSRLLAVRGRSPSPVCAAWLDSPSLVPAAIETAATGATEFRLVAAVRGPDAKLMARVLEGLAAIRAAVGIRVACSLGMLTQEQVDELREMGVHRHNHNLETARSCFPDVVTTHTSKERFDTLRMVRDAGMAALTVLPHTTVAGFQGDSVLRDVVLRDTTSGAERSEQFDGVFVFIGQTPNTELAAALQRDDAGFIVTDTTLSTSTAGVFAAGDARAGSANQAASAAGGGGRRLHWASAATPTASRAGCGPWHRTPQ